MKRQIKFRGKTINDKFFKGEWIDGYYSKVFHRGKLVDVITDGAHEIPIQIDTLGQFTGLLDKNGKEIYEGDISQDKLGRISICEFHHGGYWVRTIETSYSERLHSDSQIEVVGNIHDNPELLKGGKE